MIDLEGVDMVAAVAALIDEAAYPAGDPRAEMLWCALTVAERTSGGYPDWLDYKVRSTLRLAVAHGTCCPNDPPGKVDAIRHRMVTRMTADLLTQLDGDDPYDEREVPG